MLLTRFGIFVTDFQITGEESEAADSNRYPTAEFGQVINTFVEAGEIPKAGVLARTVVTRVTEYPAGGLLELNRTPAMFVKVPA